MTSNPQSYTSSKPSDTLRTNIPNTALHTPHPRSARNNMGIVRHDHGAQVFPDTNAHFQGEHPQHLYSVRFEARELWGDEASSQDAIYIDLWESYLDRP